MQRLFHGSILKGIKCLKPISKFHEDDSKLVVYLTENLAYSLFYIWDEVKNNRIKKWVTCKIEDGVVIYEEQFSDQLKRFYDGVKGYVYTFKKDESFIRTQEEDMCISFSEADVDGCEEISNVYDRLIEYEMLGKVIIKRFDSLSKTEKSKMIDKMSDYIIMKGLLNVDNEQSRFISSNHIDAWEYAKEKSKTRN
ncbi:MAG: hypothetical protein KKH92_07100 [Firmicutes bacterium]|nr:hypothetical protein [Bacillota bacterium]